MINRRSLMLGAAAVAAAPTAATALPARMFDKMPPPLCVPPTVITMRIKGDDLEKMLYG